MKHATSRSSSLIAHAVLLAAAGLFFVPFAWLICASLKTPEDLFHYLFFAPTITFTNFRQLFVEIPFVRYFMNSLYIAGMVVTLQTLTSAMAGYALAKFRFRGKTTLMLLWLGSMMIPGQVLVAPVYRLLFHLHLVDTFTGLILPASISLFGVFIFTQYLRQIPDMLIDSARMDGCGEAFLFWEIILPLSKPIVGALCLMSFMQSWNNFLWPQIMIHSEHRLTIPIALNQMVGVYSNQYSVVLAGTVLSILPVLLLFLLFQKEFIAGLTSGAVKE